MTIQVNHSRFALPVRWAGLTAGLALVVVLARPLSGAEAKPDDKKAEGGKTNAPPKVVIIPKAVFSDDNKAGKDPFFPNSIRRNPPPPPPIIKPDEPVKKPDAPPPPPPPPPDLFKGFSLRGISGTATRKFATINTGVKSYIFKGGERQEVRVPGDKRVMLRCLAIQDESVEIAIEGKPDRKVLPLRAGP